MTRRGLAGLAGWIILCVPVFVAGGFGIAQAAWAAVLLPLVIRPEGTDPGPVSILLLGAAALSGDAGLFTVLTCGAALLLVWKASSVTARVSGAVSAVLCGLFMIMSTGQEVIAPAALETHRGEVTVWENTVSLDSSRPAVRFRTGNAGGTFSIDLDIGGLRDDEPAALLSAGGRTFGLSRGHTALEIGLEPGEGDVTVELVRPWHPFQHPVVHFGDVRFHGGGVQ